ncbi:MAG: hypothetical protein O7C75_01885, partial [Verrucomicrobia bacterium]|nr:hypothetical protein [Verrucomicrobiota bacterium]
MLHFGVIIMGMLKSKTNWRILIIMDSTNYGKPNPNAPIQLSTFAFLIGKWNCEVTLKQEDGSFSQLQAMWEGRYILDGYVIADEYRMVDASGKLLMLGMNYRAYDSEINSWNI